MIKTMKIAVILLSSVGFSECALSGTVIKELDVENNTTNLNTTSMKEDEHVDVEHYPRTREPEHHYRDKEEEHGYRPDYGEEERKKAVPYRCLLFDEYLSSNTCSCGDMFGLCPSHTPCDQDDIHELCWHVSQGDPTCHLKCYRYVASCCGCKYETIVSFQPTSTDSLRECDGKRIFDECGLPAFVYGTTDENLCSSTTATLKCDEDLPFCFSGNGARSTWMAKSDSRNKVNFLPDDVNGVRLAVNSGDPGQTGSNNRVTEVAFFWKAKRTYANIINVSTGAKYKVKVSDGFYGNNKCGQTTYGCHDIVPAPPPLKCLEGSLLYRDIIKDCCGWFISNEYDYQSRPSSCNRQWRRFNPFPVTGDDVGIIGEEATPCFTGLEWVGVRATVACGNLQGDVANPLNDYSIKAYTPVEEC